MRRDYFICVFLLLVAVALSFVCLLPTCYTYDAVIVRHVGIIEKIVSIVFALITILAFPILTAVKKKFWAMLGNAAYGLLAFIPGMFLPGMAVKLAAPDVGIFTTVKAFFLKAIYTMTYAPFVGIGSILGDKAGQFLPKLILPLSLLIYGAVKLFRFYKEAYIAERLAPVPTNEAPKPRTRKPDILGTVISAPVNNSTTTTVTPAAEETRVTPNVRAAQPMPDPKPKAQPMPDPKPKAQPMPDPRPKPQPMPDPRPKAQQVSPPPQRQQIPAKQKTTEGVRSPNINVSFDTIPLGAPDEKPPVKAPDNSEAIQLGAPKDQNVIQLDAPKNNDVIQLDAPKDRPIELGPPK